MNPIVVAANMRRVLRLLVCTAALAGCAGTPAPPAAPKDLGALREQVFATERAFAKTMADRNLAAFSSFVAEDAVFFTRNDALRGRAQVVAFWKRFYEEKAAPFSWEPARVDVLDSGALALSTGPVFDPSGKRFATFTSVWRLEAPGTWRIVLDKGDDYCDCAAR